MIIKEQRGRKCPKGWRVDKATGISVAEGVEMVVGDLPCEECDHFKFRTTNRPNLDKNGNPYYDRHTRKPIMGTDEFCKLLLEMRSS